MIAYIEKQITEIVYKKGLFGRKIPFEQTSRIGFLFDMYAWLNMSEMENIALSDLGQWDDTTFMLNVSYYAAISATKDRGVKVDFTKEDIARFLDKLPNKDFREIFDTMIKSRFMGKSLEDWAKANQGDSKKKSTHKTSKTLQSQNSD